MSAAHLTTSEAKEDFAELINRVAHYKEHIILTRRGHEVAAIVPIEDFLFLNKEKNKNELEEALVALKEAREQGVISLEEFKKEIG